MTTTDPEPPVTEPAATRAAAESFEASASVYDELLRHNRAGAERLVSALPDAGVRAVLDVGCGTGFATLAMLGRFPVRRLVAVDPSQAMLDLMRPKVGGREGLEVEFVRAGVHDMPVEPGSFDTVVSAMAFHWFPRKPEAMEALAAAARPGGVVGVLTAGRGSEAELREIMAGIDGLPDAWHAVFDLIHRDEREMEDLMERAGLVPVDCWAERRRRRVPPQQYLDRIRATSTHVSADLDPDEAEAHWERVSRAVHEAAGPRGFEYTFVKTFAIGRRPEG